MQKEGTGKVLDREVKAEAEHEKGTVNSVTVSKINDFMTTS